ncbi:MAG: VOC family protein [Chloroflexi bacterium]|nr:VOC family protein [Chloroflexota bacterium]
MPHPVTHFEINAKDQASAIRFYSSLFGWSVDTNQPGGYGLVDTRTGIGVNGGIVQNPMGQSMVTFYVDVTDVDATLQRAQNLGGRIVVPPQTMGPVTFALFSDPEGNVIGIARDEHPSPAPAPARKTVKRTAKKAAKKAARKATKRAGTRRRR